MTTNGNALLLDSVCELLPPDDADRIRGLSPTDHMTYFEAFVAVNSCPGADSALKHALVDAISDIVEAVGTQTPRPPVRIVRFEIDCTTRAVAIPLQRQSRPDS